MGFDYDSISQNIDRNQYTLLGSGSGRIVYDLGNGYVVKKAKNRKGIAQNKAEYQIASGGHSDIFARIIDVSEQFNFLIMEKAERMNSISEVWKYFHVKGNHELFQLEMFRKLGSRYSLIPNDLFRKTSWGMVNGRPVIIDYGFTKETRKYYRFFG